MNRPHPTVATSSDRLIDRMARLKAQLLVSQTTHQNNTALIDYVQTWEALHGVIFPARYIIPVDDHKITS